VTSLWSAVARGKKKKRPPVPLGPAGHLHSSPAPPPPHVEDAALPFLHLRPPSGRPAGSAVCRPIRSTHRPTCAIIERRASDSMAVHLRHRHPVFWDVLAASGKPNTESPEEETNPGAILSPRFSGLLPKKRGQSVISGLVVRDARKLEICERCQMNVVSEFKRLQVERQTRSTTLLSDGCSFNRGVPPPYLI